MKYIIKLQFSLLFLCSSLSSASTPSMMNASAKPQLFMMETDTSLEKKETQNESISNNPITILPNPALATIKTPSAETTPTTPSENAPTLLMASQTTPSTEKKDEMGNLEKKDETTTTQSEKEPMLTNDSSTEKVESTETDNEKKETIQEESSTEPLDENVSADENPLLNNNASDTSDEEKISTENQTPTEESSEKNTEVMDNETENQTISESENDVEDAVIEEKEIIVMNSTNSKIAIYGQNNEENEICIAQHLGPIAKIVIPSTISHLRVLSEDPSYIETPESIIENSNLSIIGIQDTNDYDAQEKTLQILSLKEESEQGLIVYNTTTKTQQIKAVYPDDASFFYTPKIYYTIPALSARFMTLPIFNQKGKQTRIHVTLDHSKKKVLIPAGTHNTICALYQEDGLIMIDNITEHFM